MAMFHPKRGSTVTLPALLALFLCGMSGIGAISCVLIIGRLVGIDFIYEHMMDFNGWVLSLMRWPGDPQLADYLTLCQIAFGGFFIGAGIGYFFLCRDRANVTAP